uniref:Uncharacterized protein n=1 Tax=Anguilla anguilla TaxID=7936 RepID=A0A0E9U7B3_ANGAN
MQSKLSKCITHLSTRYIVLCKLLLILIVNVKDDFHRQ